jgi:D-alanyl-D-alanine carboxypeptidase
MAIPAAERSAAPATEPPNGRSSEPSAASSAELDEPRRSRRRPGRLAGALLATVAGLAVLGVGLVRTATGLAGPPPDLAAGASAMASPAALPPGGSSAPGGGSSPGAGPSSPSPSGAPPPPTASPIPGSSARPVPTPQPGAAAIDIRLQATLDRLRTKLGIPGVSASIVFPDGRTWTGVSGLAVVASKTKVAPETAFAFASVSKTFTSALILQLVGEGKLRLSDPAAGLLPRLRLTVDRRITVGMLLNHTSGLADYFLNPKIDGPLQGRPAAAWTIDRTLRYVGKRLSAPGAAWHYSNTNYLLLGLIAERITGQTLAEAIRTRLLEPNGLGATWYQAGERSRAPVADGYRLPGTKVNVKPIDLADGSGLAPFRSVITAAAGAGAMAGTSADLTTWARALYSGEVLGPDGTALLLSGFSKTANYLPGAAYGYGVQAFSIDGHPALGHSGRLLGFRSVVRHFPVDGLTIAVLTNQSRADPAVILRALLAGAQPVPWTCPLCPMAG